MLGPLTILVKQVSQAPLGPPSHLEVSGAVPAMETLQEAESVWTRVRVPAGDGCWVITGSRTVSVATVLVATPERFVTTTIRSALFVIARLLMVRFVVFAPETWLPTMFVYGPLLPTAAACH